MRELFFLVFSDIPTSSECYYNEIAQCAMKSEQARMKSASQMKLNPPARRQGGFQPRRGFHPPERVDLAEKSTVTVLFSGVDEWT
ncbi:MAG: hypothetical protein IIW39_00215 [Clostridia bacterium]|nr:hypothetical protein [Clostridia bacterium]